jgi:hypothetical protein
MLGMSDPTSPWQLWSDEELQLLLDRAHATQKSAQATAILSELSRRQDSRTGAPPVDRFSAGERHFLEQLATVLDDAGASFEGDDKLFLQVGNGRWMHFQHLDGAAIRMAIANGEPPSRRAPPRPLPPPTDLYAPELGGPNQRNYP